jgi:hypothetical protein
MKWVAVLFAKDTLVPVDCVLNGKNLTGPEYRIIFQYQCVQGDCSTCQCLDLEMKFSNGDKRSMQLVRIYHGPESASKSERMRGHRCITQEGKAVAVGGASYQDRG